MTILEVESVDGAAVPVVVGIGTAFGKGFVAGVLLLVLVMRAISSIGWLGK
ncbi:hypothetical protein G3I15_51535 [Streptomyces sp. SID10244]|nr:hypothetical protein [Streptomyces sp. SID10244]